MNTVAEIKARTKKSGNAIQCISCNAPVELIGNQQRAKILVCSYCGTAMDCKNEFRALYAFTHVEKPNSHLRIGMSVDIDEVDFTINALIIYESLQGSDEEWVEYQLYSEKYGYALLVIREGKCCFLRKTYHVPSPNIWLLNKGDTLTAKQHTYAVEDFSISSVLHSEGALLETIKQDKRDKHCFARVDGRCYYSKFNINKAMYYEGRYVDI